MAEARKKVARKQGRHERLEGIWLRLFDIIHNELGNYQSPLSAEDRAGIRALARETLTLMDEHERLDA